MLRNKGFTLLELLVVISIIGIMATIAVISFGNPRKAANDTKRKSELKQYQNSLEVYATKNDSKYPIYSGTTNVRTGSSFCSTLGVSPCPEDPSSPSSDYKYQSDAAGIQYVLWADLEKDTIAGGDNYFVLCSTGQAGIALAGDMPPSGGACPTLQ